LGKGIKPVTPEFAKEELLAILSLKDLAALELVKRMK
jgi:hypothetical protein